VFEGFEGFEGFELFVWTRRFGSTSALTLPALVPSPDRPVCAGVPSIPSVGTIATVTERWVSKPPQNTNHANRANRANLVYLGLRIIREVKCVPIQFLDHGFARIFTDWDGKDGRTLRAKMRRGAESAPYRSCGSGAGRGDFTRRRGGAECHLSLQENHGFSEAISKARQ